MVDGVGCGNIEIVDAMAAYSRNHLYSLDCSNWSNVFGGV